ncbi:murein hydrolase activator EnvC family protein [Clavibacter michiganensis]|uniref:murein hydrolase activator EnvC family protein n=1 Tax=Clavibacter michiganensis TaxID=28447 RepID=UPI00068D1EAE|nr:M23 family metallopeptidase [Clavibacter michiganensis]
MGLAAWCGPVPAGADAVPRSPGAAGTSAALAGPAHATDAPTTPRWAWPVNPPHVVTRPFEAPATAYGPGHRGIDIAADPGTEVRAVADGTVSFAGVVVDRPVVSVQHAGGLVSSVEPVVPAVAPGDVVRAGQVIGTVAAEPRHEPSGGVHLGARLHGEYVDPALLLAALRHAVLLPLDP